MPVTPTHQMTRQRFALSRLIIEKQSFERAAKTFSQLCRELENRPDKVCLSTCARELDKIVATIAQAKRLSEWHAAHPELENDADEEGFNFDLDEESDDDDRGFVI